MKANEGALDRLIRIALGLGFLAMTVIGPKTWWGLLGLIPLVTGLVGFCPLYRVFGLDTCPVRRS